MKYTKYITEYKHNLNAKVTGYSYHMYRAYNKILRYCKVYIEDIQVLFIDDIKYEHFKKYELLRKKYWIKYDLKLFGKINMMQQLQRITLIQ